MSGRFSFENMGFSCDGFARAVCRLALGVSAAGVASWWGAAAQEGAAQVKVRMGDTHGVWLKADGSVWTRGANNRGQLGIDGDHAFAPMRVPELSGIRDIAAGDRFTAAVRDDGTLWTWGQNE
jgi:alpha-tubulin suppressor-like RCC1 family protein